MDDPPPIDSSAPGDAQPRGWVPPETQRERPLPLRQMGIGEILDSAIQLYRREWMALIGIVALVLVPLSFLQFYLTRALSTAPVQPGLVRQDEITAAIVATGVLGIAEFLFVQPFLVAAVARAAANVYLGEPVTIGATYRFALTRVHSILWISILNFLALVLGLVLLVIPFFIVLVRMTFAPTVLVVEGIRGPKALGRSWRLAGGHFWRLAGTLLLAGLIAGVVSSVLTVPTEFAALGLGENGWPVRALGSSLATVLVTPFSTLITVLLYFDLRIRKEGYDIEVLTQELAPRT
jgi:hypothetical protein